MIRLQRTLVDAAHPFAKQVIDAHWVSSQNALKPILTGSSNKLGKLQQEAAALQKAW